MKCLSLRAHRIALLAATALVTPLPAAEVLEFADFDAAGISGFRAHWDKTIPLQEDGQRRVQDAVVKDRGQTAVWDGAIPGPLAFDAVHRNLLVRFPSAAEGIAKALAQGKRVTKVELVLPFLDEEIWPQGRTDFPSPDGYRYRSNWDADNYYRGVVRSKTEAERPNEAYREQRPNWHAIAQVLRKPWQSGPEVGPTYNAAINKAVYWKRFGAADENEDRFPEKFGPTEVSVYQSEGRMDLTKVLADAKYGATLGERLRLLSDCGVILSKWEVYDSRYFQGAYEFAISSGPRAILIKKPKLVVSLGSGSAETIQLPPPINVGQLAALHQGNPLGQPTAIVPSKEQVSAWNKKFMSRPSWMPEWQYAHVVELMGVRSNGQVKPFYYRVTPEHVLQDIARKTAKSGASPEEADYEVYLAWLDWIQGRPPRFWEGHLTAADNVTHWYNFHEAMPEPVKASVLRNWTAWLMPDRETAPTDAERKNFNNLTGQLIHPMADDPRVGVDEMGKQAEWGQGDTYYKKTGDWRGNKSFYRSGFTCMVSTANFNSGATSGALLNGQIVGAKRAIEDGRIGLMKFPFWTWTYNSGLGQEYVDHYYWAIASAGNKLFSDFCENPQDQMAGWSILQKTVNDLAISYHPNLKKLLGPASRTYFEHVLGQQDGLYHILHVLSKKGALNDAESGLLPALTWPEPDAKGQRPKPLSAWGHDYPPESVALNSMTGPWGDPWITEWVDEKPLPWRILAEKKVVADGDWVTTYFGENYGLTSIRATPQRIHLLGHWRRNAHDPSSMRDIGTMDVRVGFNETLFGNDLEGTISKQGDYRTYQHDNKLILLAKPNPKVIAERSAERPFGQKRLPAEEILSAQCSVGLFNYEDPEPTWEIFIDGQKAQELPAAAKFGQTIAIRDGVSFLAFRALPGTDLGRTAEVTLQKGKPQTQAYHEQTNIQPALVINAHFFKKENPGDEKFDVNRLAGAMGGFVIEMGDEREYGSFAKFLDHVHKATLAATQGAKGLEVAYQSGEDSLRASWDEEGGTPSFTVNGKDPYADAKARGVWQETPLSEMGLSRKMAKAGAVVEREPVTGTNPMFLQVFPQQKTAVCINPVPGYKAFRFRTPNGVSLIADGLVSMSQWAVRDGGEILLKSTRFELDPEFMPSPEKEATALFVSGLSAKPKVANNGADISDQVKAWKNGLVDGWLIPLSSRPLDEASLSGRFAEVAARIDAP